MSRMLGRKHGLLFNDGQSWKAQRRYALKTLKDFGFGRKGLEGVLVEEADRLADHLRAQEGRPTLVLNLFKNFLQLSMYTLSIAHGFLYCLSAAWCLHEFIMKPGVDQVLVKRNVHHVHIGFMVDPFIHP